MPVVVPRYTIRDLESFPDDGNRYELLDGVLLVTPAPAPLHDVVAGRIALGLGKYFELTGKARIFTHGSVEIEPNVHLEPDLLVVPTDQPRAGLGPETRWTDIRAWWLAVEISGRGSRVYDRDHKGPAYLALGVREFWRVDLDDREVFVANQAEPDPRRVDARHVWHPPEMVESFVLDVPILFAEIAEG